jgi:hypothetical protein
MVLNGYVINNGQTLHSVKLKIKYECYNIYILLLLNEYFHRDKFQRRGVRPRRIL